MVRHAWKRLPDWQILARMGRTLASRVSGDLRQRGVGRFSAADDRPAGDMDGIKAQSGARGEAL